MLNSALAMELTQKLREAADALDTAVQANDSLAEKVLDFERGVCPLPELLSAAKEILEET